MKKLILLFILINITKNSVSQKNNPYNKTNDQLNNMSKSYLRMIGEDDNIDAQHPINASDPNHKEYIENVFNEKRSNSAVDVTNAKEKDAGTAQAFNLLIVTNSKDWYKKGYDAYYAKEYENAIIYFNNAIQLNPDYADAFVSRGSAKSNLNDYTGAIEDYNKAIQLNPDDADAYYNRGIAKRKLQDYTGAIADYNKAIQLKPDYADAYNNRGTAKYNIQDYNGAIEDYNKAIQLNPDYAIKLNPWVARAYNKIGEILLELYSYNIAIANFNQAIQLNPNYAEAFYNRGFAKRELKDKYGACADYSKAGELGYSDAYTKIKKYCK